MSESEWFVIKDLSEFTDKARIIVYTNFGEWQQKIDTDENIVIGEMSGNTEELDKILSHQESLVIVKENIKKQKNKKTKENRFVINEKIFADIVYMLNDRMTSNIVSGLVQKGLIESAFDNESNDFVFWVKEDEKEKPKTD